MSSAALLGLGAMPLAEQPVRDLPSIVVTRTPMNRSG